MASSWTLSVVACGLLGLSLVACTPGTPASLKPAQPTPQGDIRAELVSLLAAGDQATLERDGAVLNRIFAEDLVVVTPIGSVMGKAELLAPFMGETRSSPLASIVSDFDNATVRIYGSTATMSVRSQHVFTPESTMEPTTYKNTYVLTYTGGRWQVNVLHSTRLR